MDWKPTHRHVKSGGEYMHIDMARVQTAEPLKDMAQVELYKAKDGTLWVRPVHEFHTRFIRLPSLESSTLKPDIDNVDEFVKLMRE